jgi:enoyl-CoA hydratase/carnithine racemase
MDDAPVLVERLTMNRPHALNAVNAELAADDAKEGTRVFGEKRRPQWQAR